MCIIIILIAIPESISKNILIVAPTNIIMKYIIIEFDKGFEFIILISYFFSVVFQ